MGEALVSVRVTVIAVVLEAAVELGEITNDPLLYFVNELADPKLTDLV